MSKPPICCWPIAFVGSGIFSMAHARLIARPPFPEHQWAWQQSLHGGPIALLPWVDNFSNSF